MIRDIVVIDDEKCNGCGDCVPSCAEGALRIENGKARLVAERLCDGMAACIGHCPRGAIRIEQREADAFDEAAVAATTQAKDRSESRPGSLVTKPPVANAPVQPIERHGHHGGGCPGSRAAQLRSLTTVQATPKTDGAEPGIHSELETWPVKLKLLGPRAPFLQGAKLLVAADCAAFACGDFHSRLLRGRVPAMACPKLEDMAEHVERLTQILTGNTIQEIVVTRMVVPCCSGVVTTVRTAATRAGYAGPITEIVAGLEGETVQEHTYRIE